MALATNTTPGSVVLGGDLTGVANAPELRVTGVVPGSFGPVNLVADAKGRLVYAKTSTWVDIEPNLPVGSTTTPGPIQVCGGLKMTGDVMSFDMIPATYTSKGAVILSNNFTAPDGILTAEFASATVPGVVRIGTNLVISGGLTYNSNSIPATASTLGTLKPGVGFTIDVAGSIAIADATYTSKGIMQVASSNPLTVSSGTITIPNAGVATLGVVKIGAGLSIDGSGTGTIAVPYATTTSKGIVQIGSGFNSTTGTLEIPDSTTNTKGIVQIGGGLDVIDGVISSALATNTTLGLVFSADSQNLTITSSELNTGPNIPLLNTRNVFSKVVRSQYKLEGVSSAGSMDFTTLEVLQQNTSWSTFTTPTGPSGSTFAIRGTAVSTDVGFRASVVPSMYDVTYNGSIYVGVSLTNSYTSTNGIDWTSHSLPSSLSGGGYIGIAWNGTVFCVRRSGASTVFTSIDGATWTSTSITATTVTKLVAKGTTFYASSGTFMYVSTNGTTWSNGSNTYFIDPVRGESGWNNFIWNGTKFCAIRTTAGGDARTATSTDGMIWTPSSNLPSTQVWTDIAWNGTTFLVINSANNTVARSTNGTTWTSHTATFQKQPESSIFGLNGVFVTSTWNGYISKSTDGITWVNMLNPSGNSGYGQTSYARFFGGDGNTIHMISPSTTQHLTSAVQPFNFSSAFKFSNACPISDFTISGVWVDGVAYCSYI